MDYYGAQVGFKNLIVADNGSTDCSIRQLPRDVGVINIPRDRGFSDTRRAKLVSRIAEALLNYFDIVMYVDCDEFVVPEPSIYKSLHDYFLRNDDQVVNALGFNVVQRSPDASPIAADQPVFNEERYVRFADAMCKPVAIRSKVLWGGGFHSCNSGVNLKRDLYLFHMKNADLSLRLARQEITRDIDWEIEVGRTTGPGVHQRLDDSELIKKFAQYQSMKVSEFDELADDAFAVANENIVNVGQSEKLAQRRYRVKVVREGSLLRRLAQVPERFLSIV